MTYYDGCWSSSSSFTGVVGLRYHTGLLLGLLLALLHIYCIVSAGDLVVYRSRTGAIEAVLLCAALGTRLQYCGSLLTWRLLWTLMLANAHTRARMRGPQVSDKCPVPPADYPPPLGSRPSPACVRARLPRPHHYNARAACLCPVDSRLVPPAAGIDVDASVARAQARGREVLSRVLSVSNYHSCMDLLVNIRFVSLSFALHACMNE